jgi:FkbM family methyltransferase
MTISFRFRFALSSLRAWKLLLDSPVFCLRLAWKRLVFLFARRFTGPTIVSPDGTVVFNTQSLISAWDILARRELDGMWIGRLRETVSPVVVDVGANMGIFGRMVGRINPSAQIIAIDPWSDMRRFNDHAHFLHFAAGSRSGMVTLQKSKRGNGWTGTTQPPMSGDFYTGHTERCSVNTVDSMVPPLNPEIEVLKIDVDGAEFDALVGAVETIRRSKAVILETSDDRLTRVFGGSVVAMGIHHPELFAAIRQFNWTTRDNFNWIGERCI